MGRSGSRLVRVCSLPSLTVDADRSFPPAATFSRRKPPFPVVSVLPDPASPSSVPTLSPATVRSTSRASSLPSSSSSPCHSFRPSRVRNRSPASHTFKRSASTTVLSSPTRGTSLRRPSASPSASALVLPLLTLRTRRYAEAVINTLKITTRGSPFYNPSLVAQIKVLSERFGAAPGQKESGKSWIASKVPRPTVNSLWSTFEGGFNKFVAGDSDPTPQKLAAKAEVAKSANGATLGPFSHYSSISPGSTSGTLSRAQSSSDLASANHLQALAPPVRPLSAAGPVSPHPAQSSLQPHPSPGPPPVKRAPYKGHHARSSSLGAFAGYDYNPNAPPPWQAYTPPAAPAHGAARNNGQESTGKAAEQQQQNYTASPEQHSEAGGRRPQFAAVGDRFQEDDSGFISPMAQYTPSVTPAPRESFEQQQQQGQPQTHRRMTTAQELADLGIGNSKSKKPAFDTLDEELDAEEGGVTPTERAPPTADSNGSTPAPGPTIGGKDGDKPGSSAALFFPPLEPY